MSLFSRFGRRERSRPRPAPQAPPPGSGPALDVTIREPTDDQVLRIMVAEVADLTRAMREFLMTADRFVYFGGIVVAAALTVGLKTKEGDSSWAVLVFAPYGLAIVFGYLIQVYTEVEKRAGYKKYLERRINEKCPEPLLLESYVNSQANRNRASVIGLQVLNSLGYSLLVVLSASTTRQRFAGGGRFIVGDDVWSYHLLNLTGLALATLVLGLAGWENRHASGRAEAAAGAAYRAALAEKAGPCPPCR